jgi:acetyl esterase/lipase
MPRTTARLLLATLGAIALAGCSATTILNALVPARQLDIRNDVAYGGLPRQKLDVYSPRTAAAGPRPLVVFFYGGSWQMGERGQYLFAAEAITAMGAVAVVPDYRVYPEVLFPAFLDDAAMAVAWARRHARDWGADPDHVFLMGHSAGAHIAAMLALDPQYLARAGDDARRIAGVVGLAGPYDFLPLTSENLKRIFAPEATIARTQPINFATAGAPPMLLATGDDDTTVNPRNTARLAAKLKSLGVPVTEIRYQGLDHYTLVGYLAAPLRGRAPVFSDVAQFLREH